MRTSLPTMFPIIEKLGGWPEVSAFLKEKGLLPGPEAIRQWRKRQKQLPRDVSLALSEEAAARGIEFTMSDFDLAVDAK